MLDMETLKATFFENPFTVYLILVAVAVGLIVMWRTAGRSGRWLATGLLILAILAGGIFAMEKLVVTDREQMGLILKDIAESVPAGRIDHAMTYLDEKYFGWGKFKPAVALAVKAAIARYDIQKVSLFGDPTIEVDGKLAKCKVSAMITYKLKGESTRHPMAWHVKWIKRPEGWRIQRAEPTTDVLP